MSTPRRIAGRRPAGPASRDESPARRTGINRRAAVLVLVIGALLVSAALPLRELLAQRSDISALRERQAQAQTRVDLLEADRVRLGDPAYTAAQARQRLQLVLPGETAYVLIGPTPVPEAAPKTAAVGAGSPWYSQVWGSVRAADAAPTPRR